MIKIIINIFLMILIYAEFTYPQEKVFGTDQKVVKYNDHFYILNLEIFELREDGSFGDVYHYKVNKESNLIDVAYNLKLGYYELKMANYNLDPFKLKNSDIVKVDLRFKLPENYDFNRIYVDTQKKRLFLPVLSDDGKKYVITFPVGTGDEQYPTPKGIFKITEKKINPNWIVPPSAKKNKPNLPAVVPFGDPENGLGSRAMRLNESSYMIHGTSKKSEKGVGMNISYGCIVLRNEDIERLFDIVPLGTEVFIYDSTK